MRDPRGVVQDLSSPVVGYESGKDYSRGTNFTCMATTGTCYTHHTVPRLAILAGNQSWNLVWVVADPSSS